MPTAATDSSSPRVGADALPVSVVLRSAVRASMPEVSVVVTTRNHGRILGETVAAVMKQDFRGEFELIICDDASPDETERVMRDVVKTAPRPVTYARLERRLGPAGGRNVGIALAKGRFIAFTDSDCVPATGWLTAARRAFDAPDIGIVEGLTVPRTVAPLFSHFIEIRKPTGSFCTSNVVYRREALDGRRFDPTVWYWEDTDLGWRVLRAGWRTVFANDAVVAHQVMVVSPLAWVLWPWHFITFPQKTLRYPESRRFLFLGIWVDRSHLFADLALVGVALTAWRREAALLCIPYAIDFKRNRRIAGRYRPLKVLAYLGWDTVACLSLVVASIRHRSVVL